MASSTIPRGTKAGRDCGRNPPYYAEVDPFPTGVCTPFGSTGCGLSNGFLLPVGTPSTTQVSATGAVYDAPVNPQSYTGTIQSQNRNFKQGIIQQFNLSVERQIPGNVVLTVGYGGSRSAHVLVGQ